jgi:hypothetical protein
MLNAPSIQKRHCGLSGNCFLSSVNQPTSSRQAFSQRKPLGQELSTHASIDEGIPLLPASLTSHQISHVSLETQSEFLGASRGIPQPSAKPIEAGEISSWSRKTSSERPAKQHRVSHRCEICRKEFAQRQGVRRHQLEKHEPNYCPHCPTFRWGRLYLFKEHLKKKHPEVDLATATSGMARRCHRSDPIPTIDRTNSHFPLPRSTLGRHSRRDDRATVRSSPHWDNITAFPAIP